MSSIFLAISNNELIEVQKYLAKGGDPDSRNEGGSSLLHEAVYLDQKEIVRQLLAYGASVESLDSYGNTPLQVAAICNCLNSARVLLSYGASIDNTSEGRPWTPLMLALNENHLEMAIWLIQEGANLHHVDQFQGWTPLLVACEQGLTEVSLELIRQGAALDARLTAGDARGKSAIHLASYYGAVDIIQELILRGVDINALPEGGGLSALHWAVYNNHRKLFDFLLEYEADVDIPAKGLYASRTPLHFAISGDRCYMVQRLLECDANPLIPDQDGKTPLDLAISRYHDSGQQAQQKILNLLEAYI